MVHGRDGEQRGNAASSDLSKGGECLAYLFLTVGQDDIVVTIVDGLFRILA